MKKSKKYLIALLVTLLFCIPLYSKYMTGLTVDLSYHLTRIEGIKDVLQAHTFPIYIYPYANNGFGYAAPLFYPDLFLLMPALLYCVGVPILLSYKIFLFVITYFTALFAYVLFEYIDEQMLSQTHNINFYELVCGEYLPYTNSYDYYRANTNIEFANEESAIWDFERLGITVTFSTNYDYDDYIYMPLSWYKGYYYQELDNSDNVLYEKECTYDI